MVQIDITFLRRIVTACLSLALLQLSFPLLSQQYIAGSSVAKEEVLRKIPQEYIDKARRELVIAYQHTSHGTHVARGVFGLQDYKIGDTLLFGVSSNPAADSLEFRDYALKDYAPPGVDASDLSIEEDAFIQTTRNYLDAPENASVNVIMWAWCNIDGHDAADNYLPGMDSLIREYGPGGTKIGTGPGLRELAVSFVYMTAHANVDANVGSPTRPKEQADTITSHCDSIEQYCLDYYSIDTHDMDDMYWEDAGDDGNSTAYGGNFYHDWQDAHVLGQGYFENKMTPGGTVAYGEHTTQHITANRKGYAMWWILARIAGWNGDTTAIKCTANFSPQYNWIGREALVSADIVGGDSIVDFVEFQYSSDNTNWHPLPSVDSTDGKDTLAANGWGLTFLTENTPDHGTLNDSSVWIRVRASYNSGTLTDWDVSESFGIDNSPSTFSTWEQTSPPFPGAFSLLHSIADTMSGVRDDGSYPRFYIHWNNSEISDTAYSDSIPGSWNGSYYHASFDISDTLVGDTLFWRVLAMDHAGNSSWSDLHNAGIIQDPATDGPVYSNFQDDGDQAPGDYNFSLAISDPEGVLDDPDYPRLYYRYNTPAIDENSFDGYIKINHSTDSTYSGAINIGNEHEEDYIFWRVKAFDSSVPADSSWSSIQNGGSILRINHPPTDISLSSDSLEENSAIGSLVGILVTTDEDQDDVHSFELVSGAGDTDNISFQLNESGELLSAEIYDYEEKQSYSIRIRTKDIDGDSLEKAFQIRILNVNEAPFADSLTLLPTDPDQNADLILAYAYSDPENDAEAGTQIQWYKDNTHQALLDNILTVVSTNTTPGEEWYATVQPSDGSLSGAVVNSPQIIISGEPPVVGCLDETLSEPSGSISDNSGTSTYPNNSDCRKLIQPAGADYITLTFTSFNTEANYDSVYVYDGPSTSDPLLGAFTGSNIPGPITSSDGSMLVHFISDYSVVEEGWTAEYTSGELLPFCINETFTAGSGIILDNTRDDNYMNNADCQKLIQATGASEITLSFTEFDLENGNDYVRIYDGTSISDPLLGEFTGVVLPGAIISSGGSMLIHFSSNDTINAAGWTASYTSNAPVCGPCLEDTFTEATGELTDNSCEGDYLNDTDCQKLIQPADADYITLTFSAFNTEANYDYVRVYDGPGTSDPLLGSYTGTTLPAAITSSGGSMLVHFTSDYSETRSGWTASYTSGIIEPICLNETFTAGSGTVLDNSSDEDYMNNADCQKLIQATGADEIILTFIEFNLEEGNDYVRIYDGANISDPLLGEYTGTTLPDVITSSGGSMLIHFSSNDNITASGWSASYTSNAPACGPCIEETFTDATGELSDNSCDTDYLNDSDCRKLIQPIGADYITLSFTQFSTESGYDFVRIYDGPSTSDPLLGTFSGAALPGALSSTGGSMLVHFSSDYSVTAAGWSASYTSGSIEPICVDENFTAPSGFVDDNSGTVNYMNDAACQKLIQPTGADSISLSFTSFDLENGNDYLWVYDGASTTDPLLGLYTGNTLPESISSSGGSMLILFTSNESITASGWSASYTSSGSVLCGPCQTETFTAPSGELADNSCEADYLNNTNCSKLIQPVGATNITLNFTAFDTESGYDFVRVYEGTSTSGALLGQFSGNSIPGSITSSGGSMLVHFTSDHSITAQGWEASYEINTPVCEPCTNTILTESAGMISDDTCGSNYINNTDCQKLIQPLGADYVTLTFTTFDVESGYDFVRIYDGTSTSDSLLGEYSGAALPGVLTSSGGSMLIHFTSDYSITAAGWSAEYVAGTNPEGTAFSSYEGLIMNTAQEDVQEKELVIFPNPSDGKFSIRLENGADEGMDNVRDDELILMIIDPSGRIVVEKMIQSDGMEIQEEIDFRDKPAGIYFIQLYNTSFRQIGKVVVY